MTALGCMATNRLGHFAKLSPSVFTSRVCVGIQGVS